MHIYCTCIMSTTLCCTRIAKTTSSPKFNICLPNGKGHGNWKQILWLTLLWCLVCGKWPKKFSIHCFPHGMGTVPIVTFKWTKAQQDTSEFSGQSQVLGVRGYGHSMTSRTSHSQQHLHLTKWYYINCPSAEITKTNRGFPCPQDNSPMHITTLTI